MSKWTYVSVNVCTLAWCYWVSLTGGLLALDQNPKATLCLFEASGQLTSDWRSMESTGSSQKPQTLANRWAGVTLTILLTKKLTFRQSANKKLRLVKFIWEFMAWKGAWNEAVNSKNIYVTCLFFFEWFTLPATEPTTVDAVASVGPSQFLYDCRENYSVYTKCLGKVIGHAEPPEQLQCALI